MLGARHEMYRFFCGVAAVASLLSKNDWGQGATGQPVTASTLNHGQHLFCLPPWSDVLPCMLPPLGRRAIGEARRRPKQRRIQRLPLRLAQAEARRRVKASHREHVGGRREISRLRSAAQRQVSNHVSAHSPLRAFCMYVLCMPPPTPPPTHHTQHEARKLYCALVLLLALMGNLARLS